MCQTAGSIPLNPNIACLLDIEHIAWRNHCLNRAMKDIEEVDAELKNLSTKTLDIHCTINGSNILSAALYNVHHAAHKTKLKLMAVTRWILICDMYNSHTKASEEI